MGAHASRDRRPPRAPPAAPAVAGAARPVQSSVGDDDDDDDDAARVRLASQLLAQAAVDAWRAGAREGVTDVEVTADLRRCPLQHDPLQVLADAAAAASARSGGVRVHSSYAADARAAWLVFADPAPEDPAPGPGGCEPSAPPWPLPGPLPAAVDLLTGPDPAGAPPPPPAWLDYTWPPYRPPGVAVV